MDPAIPQYYSASQIADVLGMSKRAILYALKDVPPISRVIIAGNLASVWAVEKLPANLQVRWQAAIPMPAKKIVEPFQASKQWEPPLKLDQVQQKFIDRAIKLRDALAQPLARQHEVDSPALLELGLKEFIRVFGYAISARQWNRLFDRTVKRDGGRREWLRTEIYLDHAAFQKPEVKITVFRNHCLHRGLDEVVNNLENKADPTPDDRAWLFDAVFQHFEKLVAETVDKARHRLIKNSLISYLFSSVPALSRTPKALRRLFELTLTRWRENGRLPSAIMDSRRMNSGNFLQQDFTEDKRQIRNKAIVLGGNESLAHRLCRREGKLSPGFCEHYNFDPRKGKSYVPKTIREDITPKVNMCGPLHRGPWEAKMRGPWIPRNPSDTQPADYFSGDDVTWNHYWFYQNKEGGYEAARGECLVMCDFRTGYMLQYLLINGKYTGRHIRGLILKTHDLHGLPHIGMYLEKGVWACRFVEGPSQSGHLKSVHWRELELGLKDRGLDLSVRHATTPRAKPIEGLFHVLQDRMRGERGFVGFNERLENMERMQDFLARVRAGKEHPGNELLSMEDWAKRIDVLLAEFNSDPQNGKMLPGKSPLEAWQESLNHRPLRKLPDDARYILATHKTVVTVRQEGILLKIGNQRLLYCNERTGELIGRQVLAFYNIDFPELLTVSDMKRQNYFSVRRIELPAMTATREQFAAVHAQIRGHMQAAKAIYGEIQHPVVATITRDTDHDETVKELGRFHNEQVEQARAEVAINTGKLRKIQVNAAARGINGSLPIRNPDRVLRGQEWENEVRAKLMQKEQAAPALGQESQQINL